MLLVGWLAGWLGWLACFGTGSGGPSYVKLFIISRMCLINSEHIHFLLNQVTIFPINVALIYGACQHRLIKAPCQLDGCSFA